MALVVYFEKAFYSVSSWSALLRDTHQRLLTEQARLGKEETMILTHMNAVLSKGSNLVLTQDATVFGWTAAAISHFSFLGFFFFSFHHTTQLSGSHFPDQGLTPHPWQ